MRLKWLFLLVLVVPLIGQANNAGIVQGLWYDREVFFAGETVRVYVAIRNNTGGDLSGTVEFFVNEERIERNNVDALDSRIIESWADWVPSFGTSTIRATLSRTEISSTASGTQAVEVVSRLAESTIFVDRDNDNDGLGNLVDPDDDNDGIPDEEDDEPLTPNTTATPEANPEANATEAEHSDQADVVINHDNGGAQGLEQFLTDSRADTTFASLTETINQTKERLDAYREDRDARNQTKTETLDTPASEVDNQNSSSSTATSSNFTIDPDGFGEITRSKNETGSSSGNGWLNTIWMVIISAISAGYSLILTLLSFILSYPSLLQVALLILIIFFVIKTAKRLAGRPT